MFTNWTSEDFTHTWNSAPFTFKAGQTYRHFLMGDTGVNIPLDANLAAFFAKHLAMRELNKRAEKGNDLPFSMESITTSPEYLKCLTDGEPTVPTSPEPPSHPIAPPAVEPEEETIAEKKKPGRPKKVSEEFVDVE